MKKFQVKIKTNLGSEIMLTLSGRTWKSTKKKLLKDWEQFGPIIIISVDEL